MIEGIPRLTVEFSGHKGQYMIGSDKKQSKFVKEVDTMQSTSNFIVEVERRG
jgi:hypothetical protein